MKTFDTNTLVAAIPSLLKVRRPQFLLSLLFPSIKQSDTESVSVDVENGRRLVAPFVAPFVRGKLVNAAGFKTNIIKPAYVKSKRAINPGDALKRAFGEQLPGGQISPAQKMDLLVMQALEEFIVHTERREEVMAAQQLVVGSMTIVGEEYPETVVSLGRDSELTGVEPDVDWDDNNPTIRADLDHWNSTMIEKCGVGAENIIFEPKAYQLFSADEEVKALLDNRRIEGAGGNQILIDSLKAEGGQYMGRFGGWNIWQYQNWYVDPADNTQKQALPDYTVLMTSPYAEGIRHYGAIQDVAAMQAMPFFPKVWDEQDPSVRFAMVQSAPMPFLHRPDATLAAHVAGN